MKAKAPNLFPWALTWPRRRCCDLVCIAAILSPPWPFKAMAIWQPLLGMSNDMKKGVRSFLLGEGRKLKLHFCLGAQWLAVASRTYAGVGALDGPPEIYRTGVCPLAASCIKQLFLVVRSAGNFVSYSYSATTQTVPPTPLRGHRARALAYWESSRRIRLSLELFRRKVS